MGQKVICTFVTETLIKNYMVTLGKRMYIDTHTYIYVYIYKYHSTDNLSCFCSHIYFIFDFNYHFFRYEQLQENIKSGSMLPQSLWISTWHSM